MTFQISTTLAQLGIFSRTFTSAFEFASKIITSTLFSQLLHDQIADSPDTSEIQSIIEGSSFSVHLITESRHLDTHCCVYREIDPLGIYFNPMLVLQLRTMEINGMSPELERTCSYFIASKLCHEVSHLLHPILSQTLRHQTIPKSEGGFGNRKMVSPQIEINGRVFDDFGEVIEYYVFGGILEIVANPRVVFEIQQIVSYPFPRARIGFLLEVKPENLVVDLFLTSFESLIATRGQEFERKSRQSIPMYFGRFSEEVSLGDSDCLLREEEEKEEEEREVDFVTY